MIVKTTSAINIKCGKKFFRLINLNFLITFIKSFDFSKH